MNMIPKIRPGEDLSIEKLNAIIDKVNGIEAAKKDLELMRDSLRADIAKQEAVLENICATQQTVQQLMVTPKIAPPAAKEY